MTSRFQATMKTASRIQIALTLVTMAALALAPSATAQTDRYRSGAGTWDATTTNWGTATGGPYTSAWSNGGNAIFEGTVGTVTLAAPISVNNITFTAASNGYTISGQTLNFIAGGSITQSVKNKKHTITSAITGSPSVSVADGTTYEGLTFAPTSGSVTLGTCTIPSENGGGDKAGLTLDGTTTGNSASTVQYASGNLYGTLWKKGTGTWTVGNVDIGTVEIDVGTLIANGAVNTYYNGLKFIGGTLKGTGPINTPVTVPASGNLSPGIANGTLSITAALNISAMAGGTGKLNYDLATPATSDKIAVTGSATIGTGVLGLNDFVFTNLGGMQAGVYTLITTTTGITGTLDSANLSGTIGGFPGTLQINGNNLEWVTTGFEMHISANSPADDATTARAYESLTATFSKPVALGSGNVTLRNLTNSTDTVIPVGDSRISVSGSVLTINPGSALQWNKNYAVRIDATAIHSTTGISFAGIFDDTTWNFSTLPADPLVDALSALKSHITGAIPLSDAQIAAHKLTIDAEKSYFATNAAGIAAALDLVTTYDSVLGPLFVSRSLPVRSAVTNDIHWALYTVMQDLMDFSYTASNITNNFSLLNGFKFGSSASFPGSCAAPADPNLTNSATISASYLNTAGRETQGDGVGTYARKPTGTYLAPGSIATVTVPAALVGTGFQIRVCAQSSDLSNRPNIRRLERSSLVYDITALATKIASPLGGGIYIEVPWLASAGTVSVQVKNAVRSPYFSAKSIQTTTPAQWLIERASPAPWADFQTDKFMMQVPTSWIYAMPDPTQLMADWDASMDATTDLMGFPRLRGKESFYLQVDVDLKNSVFSPGYPAVNVGGFSATADYGGYNSSHYLVRGPQWVSNTVTNVEFHEQGHGFFFPKFPGEIESNVNLSYVAVLHQKFGFSLDEAFRSSLGYTNTFQTLDTTAMAWMTVFNFSPREAAMNVSEKSYQLKGHAKFVDVARLFGWDKLKIYYGSYVEDPNGTTYTTDQLLLSLCNAVGKDIRPLFAFWGVYPDDPTTLGNAIAAAGLTPSREIYNALLHYRTLVPANNAAFQSFALSWWGRQPTMAGAWEEREHARQWDTTPLYSAGDQQRSQATNPGEIYNENSANDIRNRIQEILDLYYPSGIPADNTPPVVLTLSPPDDSVENSVSANLVATFTKAIVIDTGNITLKNLTDGTQSTIAITDASQVSIAGPVLTLNPTANLLPSKAYAIRIAATAIDDTAGNSFAGIANDTTWNFKTQSANSGLFTWDGTANSWTSAHWNAGAGLVSGPVGNNNYNAATINGGTVTFAATDTFGNAATMSSPVITINSGGTLASGGFFNTIWDLTLNGGTLLANGGMSDPFGSFALKGTVKIGGNAASNLSAGAGNFNTVSLGTSTGGSTTFNVADVTASNAPDLTISTVLNNNSNIASGLIKTGSGTLVLMGINTYSGNTLVIAGTLVVDGGTIAGPGLMDIGANVATPASFTLNSGNVTVGGQFVIGAHGSTGTAAIKGGVLQVNGSIYVGGYSEGTGTGTITQTGGTVTTTGGIDFGGGGPNNGTYNLNGGTLTTPGLGKNGSGSTTINFNGGTLCPSATTASFLQGHTAANVQSGGAIIDTNSFDITIAQPLLDGGGGLTKSGTGTLTLTSVNTFTGGTAVNGGTLSLDSYNGNCAIRGILTVSAGDTVVSTGDGTGLGFTGQSVTALNINGGIVTSAGAMHIWSTMSGGVNMTGGTLQSNSGVSDPNGNQLEWGNVVLNTNASANTATIGGRIRIRGEQTSSLIFNVADGTATTDLLVSAAITDASSSAGITKTGAGTMMLTGANTYTGTTTISGGVISLSTGLIYSNLGWLDKQISITGGATVVVGGWGDGATAGLGRVNFGSNNIVVDNGTIQYTGSYDGGNLDRGFTIGSNGATLNAAGAANTFTLNQGRNFGITSNASGTLTLTGSSDGFLNLNLGGAGALVKSGTGVWSITGANTFTGTTTVTAGTLALTGSSIADANKLVISGGTVNLTGAETVSTLFFGAIQQAAGTYSATGSGGTIASANFTGTGTLIVTSGPAASYASWMAPFITGGLTGDTTPNGDPDNDNINNLLEYALNGNPAVSDPAILPTMVVTSTDFEFTYSRLDLSLADTVQTFEYGSTLAGWTPVLIPAGPGVSTVGIATVTITNTSATDSIKVIIPKSASIGAKLFGRLKIVK